jgi:hypothetical protein
LITGPTAPFGYRLGVGFVSRHVTGAVGDRVLDELAGRLVGMTRLAFDTVIDQRGAGIAAQADVFRLVRRREDARAVERALVRMRSRHSGAFGVASGVPSVLAGPGTAVEMAAALFDAGVVTYHEIALVLALSHLRGRDVRDVASRRLDALLVLGLEAGAVRRNGAIVTVGDTKIDLATAEDLPDEVVQRITRKVADQIVAKVARRKARFMLGRLVPFGIGMAIAGIDDFRTIGSVGREAIAYLDAVDKARSAKAA